MSPLQAWTQVRREARAALDELIDASKEALGGGGDAGEWKRGRADPPPDVTRLREHLLSSCPTPEVAAALARRDLTAPPPPGVWGPPSNRPTPPERLAEAAAAVDAAWDDLGALARGALRSADAAVEGLVEGDSGERDNGGDALALAAVVETLMSSIERETLFCQRALAAGDGAAGGVCLVWDADGGGWRREGAPALEALAHVVKGGVEAWA